IAEQIAHVQSGDMANGSGQDSDDYLDDWDVLQLNFAVGNQLASLQAQLNTTGLFDVEEILFNTGIGVEMDSLDGILPFPLFAPGLEQVTTGSGDDKLGQYGIGMRGDGINYALGAGDDMIWLAGSDWNDVDGGSGFDQVFGTNSSEEIETVDVDYIEADD